ncbi:hypothetical protein DFH07DRAFT_812447 [Mycena maculata]|uniref:Uncharacterized protein n=1 Tax=Mycena maculata TaxID=230809 RepID=A0AAD7NJD6_9AGAR|nr:hypothetical protein DFH07DRAFT_812447 [Mycena maculata]
MKAGRNTRNESSSVGDWISNLKLLAAALKATSTCVPVPCLQLVFEALSMVLDLVETVGKNETDLKYLAESAINITTLLTDELKGRPASPDVRLTVLCADFVRYLEKVGTELEKRRSKLWFKKYLKAKSIRDTVDDFTRRVVDLRADLTLAAAVGSRFQIIDTDRRVQEVQSSLAHIACEVRTHVTSARLQVANIEEDVLLFRPSELHLDFDTAHLSVVTLGQRAAATTTDQICVKVRTYASKVGLAKVTTARVYEGEHAPQMWQRDLELFSAHLRVPGVAQIYGMCKSPRLQALIFHDELVPIDIYAATLTSPICAVDFELNLIRNFTSVFAHIATVIGVADKDYRETVADLALISRTSGSVVISHLPYNNSTAADVPISEKQLGGPMHSWFSSCGCLARVPPGNPVPGNALVPRARRPESSASALSFCSTMGNLSRYRDLSLKDENPHNLKLGAIYLQGPGDLEVVHTIAEISGPDPEIIIEDWATRKGVCEELPGGWTRFEVDLRTDCKEPGYFLSIYGSVYMPVAEREAHRTGWLLQAHSVLGKSDVLDLGWSCEDLLIAELFFVNLDWHLVPDVENNDTDELPGRLYVFVENIPVDARGCVSRPTTFWSTQPDTCRSADDIPVHFQWERFSARGSGRSWEAHHYEAARALQEENGFEPVTCPAAQSLTLPRYNLSVLPTPEK